MNLNSNMATWATVVWAVAIVLTGIVAGFGAFGWLVAGAVALLPAYALTRLRVREDPSMSEQIHKALN